LAEARFNKTVKSSQTLNKERDPLRT